MKTHIYIPSSPSQYARYYAVEAFRTLCVLGGICALVFGVSLLAQTPAPSSEAPSAPLAGIERVHFESLTRTLAPVVPSKQPVGAQALVSVILDLNQSNESSGSLRAAFATEMKRTLGIEGEDLAKWRIVSIGYSTPLAHKHYAAVLFLVEKVLV